GATAIVRAATGPTPRLRAATRIRTAGAGLQRSASRTRLSAPAAAAGLCATRPDTAAGAADGRRSVRSVVRPAHSRGTQGRGTAAGRGSGRDERRRGRGAHRAVAREPPGRGPEAVPEALQRFPDPPDRRADARIEEDVPTEHAGPPDGLRGHLP